MPGITYDPIYEFRKENLDDGDSPNIIDLSRRLASICQVLNVDTCFGFSERRIYKIHK